MLSTIIYLKITFSQPFWELNPWGKITGLRPKRLAYFRQRFMLPRCQPHERTSFPAAWSDRRLAFYRKHKLHATLGSMVQATLRPRQPHQSSVDGDNDRKPVLFCKLIATVGNGMNLKAVSPSTARFLAFEHFARGRPRIALSCLGSCLPS